MSYNARLRAKKNRAGGLYGFDRGYEVGSNVSLGIGIPSRLVRTVSERTTPMNWVNNELKDDRNLVVQQNTLSGVGRYRSQFNIDADGIKSERYYLGEGSESASAYILDHDQLYAYVSAIIPAMENSSWTGSSSRNYNRISKYKWYRI